MRNVLIKAFIVISILFLSGCSGGDDSSSYKNRLDKEKAKEAEDTKKFFKELEYQRYKSNH